LRTQSNLCFPNVSRVVITGVQWHSKLISKKASSGHTVQQSFFIVVGSIVRIEFLPIPDELAKYLFSDIFISHCWHSTMHGRKMVLSCLHHGCHANVSVNIQISNSLHSYRLDRYDEFVEQEPPMAESGRPWKCLQ
jgi:hypothetical protein